MLLSSFDLMDNVIDRGFYFGVLIDQLNNSTYSHLFKQTSNTVTTQVQQSSSVARKHLTFSDKCADTIGHIIAKELQSP